MNNSILKSNIRYLKGVGPKRSVYFSDLGIETVGDIIQHFPRDYEDRSIIKKINQLENGSKITVRANVSNIQSRRIRRNMHILKAVAEDGTGYMNLIWFNQEYYYKKLKDGHPYYFFGKVDKKMIPEMVNPFFSESLDNFAVIVPVYSKNSGLTQNIIRKTVRLAIYKADYEIKEILSENIIKENNLMDYKMAIENIHFPKSRDLFYQARERLVFQEFLLLQLALLMIKKKIRKKTVKSMKIDDFSGGNTYINNLEFSFTSAQERVLKEIRDDLKSGRIMHRLVQGDVGCGKTAVAAAVISDVCSKGMQAAFMAPTEILAMQHFKGLEEALLSIGIKTAFLTGKMNEKEKHDILDKTKKGEINLVIGTHALIQDDVQFKNLALVVTDEQHRFGVNQRSSLEEKGNMPHSLVLTATPIPRTLALILYGDLDISVIDEMPPGRKKVETYAIDLSKRDRALEFARKRMASGEQVYLVCPRIENEEENEMTSVKSIYEEMKLLFPEFNIDIMHGRMSSVDKENSMKNFYKGKIDMLVSTTVIEVGVDVPNATLMIIENAERFGLAQLHQLRGRVGRGSRQSYCVLINRGFGEVANKRMEIMEQSGDGFFIAEKDLVLRGPGEFFGTKQHGLPEFKIANIYTDTKLLKRAQKHALKMLKYDPELISLENANIIEKIDELYGDIIKM